MKHLRKSLAAAALAFLLTLTACGKVSTPLLTAEDGIYRNEESGLAYVIAPLCYEPQSVGEAYAHLKSGSMTVTLYEVSDLDPKLWLTEEYSGISFMMVSPELELPDLAGFAPDTIHLCVQNNTVWEFATVTDQAEIDEVVRHFTEGEAVPYPAATSDMHLRLKFSSPDYPGVYYNLVYVDYGDARYLYDRESKRCVEMGDLLRDYIDGTYGKDSTAPETAAPDPNL